MWRGLCQTYPPLLQASNLKWLFMVSQVNVRVLYPLLQAPRKKLMPSSVNWSWSFDQCILIHLHMGQELSLRCSATQLCSRNGVYTADFSACPYNLIREEELKGMSGRILKMRQKLYDCIVENKTPGDWSHLLKQIGMFTFTGLSRMKLRFVSQLTYCSYTGWCNDEQTSCIHAEEWSNKRSWSQWRDLPRRC